MSRVQTDLDLRFFTPQVRERTGGRLPGFTAPRVAEDGRVGQRAAQVAQALAQVNPALSRGFAQVHQNNIDEAIESAVTDRARLRVTFEEAIEKGLIDESQSPFYREAWQERDGIVAARRFQSQMRQELYESGLINSDDPVAIAAFLDERSAALLDGSSRHFALGFASEYDAIADGIFNERDQRWIQNERANSLTSFQELLSVEIEDALVGGVFDGGNPQALAALGARLTQVGQDAVDNGSVARGDINVALATVIATFAEEHDLSEAQAMLLAENIRTGPGGQSRLSSVLAVRRALAPLDEELTAEERRSRAWAEEDRRLAEASENREKQDLFQGLVADNYEIVSGDSLALFEQLTQQVLDNPAFGPEYVTELNRFRRDALNIRQAGIASANTIDPAQQAKNQHIFAQMGVNGASPEEVLERIEALQSEGLADASTFVSAFQTYSTLKGAVTANQYPDDEFRRSQAVVQGMLSTIYAIPELVRNPAFLEWQTANEGALVPEPNPHSPTLPNPEHPEWLRSLDAFQRESLRLHMDQWVTARLNQSLQAALLGRERTGEPLSPQEIQHITDGIQQDALELIKNGGPEEFRANVIEPAVTAANARREEQARLDASIQEFSQHLSESPDIPFNRVYSDYYENNVEGEFGFGFLEALNDSDEQLQRRRDFQKLGDHVAHAVAVRRNPPGMQDGLWEGSAVQKQVEINIGAFTTQAIRAQSLLDRVGTYNSANLEAAGVTVQEYTEATKALRTLQRGLQVIHSLTPPNLEYIATKTANPDLLYTTGLDKDSIYWAEYPLFWTEAEMTEAVEAAVEDEDHPLRAIFTNTGYDFTDPTTIRVFARLQRQRIQQAQQIGQASSP